jgi:hypothetical protein
MGSDGSSFRVKTQPSPQSLADMVTYGCRCKTHGKVFGKATALGLLWEKGAKTALESGVGALQPSDLCTLRLEGGQLETKVGDTWMARRWVDVDMELPDQQLIHALVQTDWETLAGLGFQVTRVDVPVMSHSASLDMQGFWACSDFKMQCPGLVACEKKLLSWWGFDGKVAKVKQEVQQRFAELAQTRYVEKFTGQLLSISQLKDDAVVLAKLFYLSSPEANKWVQLHCHKPGWPSVKCSLRTFTATTGVFKGCVVASIGSFLEACGRDNKSAFKKIPQWTNGSIPGISKKSFAYMKLEQHTGGKGWVASIEVLRHIHRYIK